MNIKWRPLTGPYQSGQEAYVGKIILGHVNYDSLRSRDDPKKYEATSTLPQIKINPSHFLTSEEAKAKVEYAIKFWFKHINDN